jgi:hypothetical protein
VPEPGLGAMVASRLALLRAAGHGPDTLASLVSRVLQHAPAEAGELEALALADGGDPAELLTLDAGLVNALTGATLEGSLGLYVDSPTGPLLAGAWALPREQAAQVELRPLAGAGGPGAGGGWLFGVPGVLGLAGIAGSGFAVIANHLRPASLGPGLPGAVVLRKLLAAADLGQARAQIEATALADGRNWMLADGQTFYGIEQLGDRRILTRVGPKTGHVHANHCFDPALRQLEASPRDPASFRRLELASTLYVQRRPASAAAVLSFLDEVEQAAFADPGARAETLLAIEITAGVAHWRGHADAPIQSIRFTPPHPP